jgi:SAM-dependent methyltransferase
MRAETAGLAILLLLIIAILIYIIGQRVVKYINSFSKISSEGFENTARKSSIVIDDPAKFYDDFYVSRIHQAYYPDSKNICRCSDLYKTAFLRLYPKEKTKTLLVGANTGRFLDALCGICPDVTGIVKHDSLKTLADTMAPKASVRIGDVVQDRELFDENTFTHVVFEDRTLYEFHSHDERRTAIQHAIRWLKPGGRLIIRVVDRDRFDPMIPTSVPLRGLNIQNYLKDRKRDSTVHFKDGSHIQTNFTAIPSEDKAVFREDLYDTNGSLVRTQVHRWSMPNKDAILEEVMKMGMEHDQNLSLAPCTTPFESYEIFVKPEYKL